MLTDHERLARQRARPVLVELWNALTRLTSTLTVMNTGAHPDDEQNGMLAALRFRYGMRAIIACSTRGEGGQNSEGPERGGALGVVRTRELEEAARVIDAEIAWLGFGPDDPVHDFGFSKNGPDTLARWGRERLLERLVRAYRRERPDIVIPTFLDVPGQHGHHRAMTEAAEAAIALAADAEAFPEQRAEGLMPWRVPKYYLPAWPGGGGTYDDELPPPNATVLVDAGGRDAATGAAYGAIGEWSRAYHASQGMGRWRAVPQTRWALHLKSGGGAVETTIADGLPADLGQLGAEIGGGAGAALAEAQTEISLALAAFPDRERIIAAVSAAAAALERADRALDAGQRAEAGHRIARKRREADAALLVAAGVSASAWLSPDAVAPGAEAVLRVQVDAPVPVAARPVGDAAFTFGAGAEEGGVRRFPVAVAADAKLSTPFVESMSRLGGNGLVSVELSAAVGGRTARMLIDLDEAAAIVPPQSVTAEPAAIVLRLPAKAVPHPVALRIDGPGQAALAGVPGFTVAARPDGAIVTPSADLRAGRYRLAAEVAGKPAFRIVPIAYPHIGRSRLVVPAGLDVLALDLALPEGARVGYVGGGADTIATALRRMGLEIAELGPDDLAGDLSRFTTIVVGIFAFGLRPDLAAATAKLHDWVRAGGHLVTLYHRPSDGWDPAKTPPAFLRIGAPSVRWRVTDPTAAVTVLAPDHPILKRPNHIGPADWAGWDKERGLYFAAEWDPSYMPLLSLHDRSEAPLNGALLSAAIGRGRHTHVSLVLHHQMDRLVPGAFRLMANLVQAAWT